MSLTLKTCPQREDMSKDADIIQCPEDMSYEVITDIAPNVKRFATMTLTSWFLVVETLQKESNHNTLVAI